MKLLLKAGISIIVTASVASGIYLSSVSTKKAPISYSLNSVNKTLPQTKIPQTQPTPVASAQTTTPISAQPSNAPNAAPPVITSPTPQENKTKIMAVITNYAKSKGMNPNMVYSQTTCFDHVFTSSNDYTNYNDLINFPLVVKYLAGDVYFDGAGTCRTLYIKTAE